MIYDVAVVRDIGDMYQVEYVTRNDLTMLDMGSTYAKISARCSDAIKVAKAKGYPVFIPKGLTEECRPEQLIIQETSALETAKNLAEYRVYSTVNETLINLSFLDIYGYLTSFAKFASRGIFITDENVEAVKALYTLDENSTQLQNRDEAYVSILQKRNAQELEDLQVFIETNDKCRDVYQRMRKARTVVSYIRAAESEDEANRLANEFLTEFNIPGK